MPIRPTPFCSSALVAMFALTLLGVTAGAADPTAEWPAKPPPGFREIKRDQGGPLPKLTDAEKRAGYLVFTRPEPGDIYPTSVPTREQIVEKIAVRVAPGRVADVNFALRPLKSFKDAGVSVSFSGGANKWPPDLRWVHCWPQRTGWGGRCRTYHIVPELLLKRDAGDLTAGKTQQYYLTVDVPAGAKPGTYRGEVTLTTGNAAAKILTVEITVLPFKLAPLPKEVTFGLYPDIGAWAKDEATTARVLAAMRRQGFNALVLSPHGQWNFENGKVSADLTKFIEFMEQYKAAGFDGRFVMSVQGLGPWIEKHVPNAVKSAYEYTPQAADAVRQYIRIIGAAAKKHQWPPYVLHVADEPRHEPESDRMKQAVRVGRIIHEEGFDLFCTIWEPGALDPYLNYRCYNGIHYISFPDGATALRRRDAARKAGDAFWHYSSGCYGDEHVLQDGNIIANRYMGGNLTWRMGATGSMSWTFMRKRSNPYFDLDHYGHAAKDAMTVYPPVVPDVGFTPTLQWEGLRIGIDDYRYFHTLVVWIDKAKVSGKPAAGARAGEIETSFKTMLEKMPWKHTTRGRYPASEITNAMLNVNRARVVDWILELQELLGKAK